MLALRYCLAIRAGVVVMVTVAEVRGEVKGGGMGLTEGEGRGAEVRLVVLGWVALGVLSA